jgi:hypothetical protein
MAKWTPKLYPFVLSRSPVEGGTIVSDLLDSYAFGSIIELPSTSDNYNYEWDGWYKNGTGPKLDNGSRTPSVVVADNNNYTAKWKGKEFDFQITSNDLLGFNLEPIIGKCRYNDVIPWPPLTLDPNYKFSYYFRSSPYTRTNDINYVAKCGEKNTWQIQIWKYQYDFTLNVVGSGQGEIKIGNIIYPHVPTQNIKISTEEKTFSSSGQCINGSISKSGDAWLSYTVYCPVFDVTVNSSTANSKASECFAKAPLPIFDEPYASHNLDDFRVNTGNWDTNTLSWHCLAGDPLKRTGKMGAYGCWTWGYYNAHYLGALGNTADEESYCHCLTDITISER